MRDRCGRARQGERKRTVSARERAPGPIPGGGWTLGPKESGGQAGSEGECDDQDDEGEQHELQPAAHAVSRYFSVLVKRYVPAGSVYFFETKDEIVSIAPAFTEVGSQIGLGQVMFAQW